MWCFGLRCGSSDGTCPMASRTRMTETERKEVIIHIAFHAGWPKAVSAINVPSGFSANSSHELKEPNHGSNTHHPEQRCEDACPRARRLPVQARRDHRRRRDRAAGRYRLIDIAAAYFNEHQVGAGIRQSGIDRSEIFVETKLWMSDYGYDEALHGFDMSVRKLGSQIRRRRSWTS